MKLRISELRETFKQKRIRNAERWAKFKERHPRVGRIVDPKNFIPAMYLQVPTIASMFAAGTESEKTWLYVTLGSAAFIPTTSLIKRGINRIRGIENGKTDAMKKFVMSDLLCQIPGWLAYTPVLRLCSDKLTDNYVPSLLASYGAGQISAYAGFTLVWYGLNRGYFRGLKKRKQENEQGLLARLKYGFAMGFHQSILFAAIEKIKPNSWLVTRINELKVEGELHQKTYETGLSEDMIELFGVSRGVDWFMLPLDMAIMASVLLLGGEGKEAFYTYFGISTTVKFIYSLSWRTASTIGTFKPRIDAKDEVGEKI